jgi:hypothetical protein
MLSFELLSIQFYFSIESPINYAISAAVDKSYHIDITSALANGWENFPLYAMLDQAITL